MQDQFLQHSACWFFMQHLQEKSEISNSGHIQLYSKQFFKEYILRWTLSLLRLQSLKGTEAQHHS